jgi:protein involved in plasmid replication-relaxation
MSGRGRARRVAQRLTARDLEVLASLWTFRLMTGVQLGRLHVSAATPMTQARKTRAILQRLTMLGLVFRLQRRIGGVRAGSDGLIFSLTGLGHAVLDLGHEAPRRHRRPAAGKPPFQDHLLAVAETYVQLVERARTGRVEQFEYSAEPQCWRHFTGSGGELVTLRPDGFVRLGVGGYEVSAFLEVDRGTENLPRIAAKIDAYVRYWRSGQEQARYGVFPKTWLLVPDAARARAISRVVGRMPAETRPLFTVRLIAEAADLLTEVPIEGGAQ